MRARAYCAHPSIRDLWALRCMSRCPVQVDSLKRDSQCLSPQASLVLIYRPTASDTLRTFGEEPTNFEAWTSEEDDTRAGTSSPNFHTTPTRGRLSSRQIKRASLAYTVGLQRY
ncbi:hypothetical protein TNCV_791301 [Trichonephila clavipes]|nr:hypothetical protein TNCV_791301 [Trichonephila clavipes]